ncbi:HTTM domain-containing protein [Paracoccus sp. YLB-12]|uniref:HTTM domain-containing protein n=1 Tax=Paracoccus maritimus TaxID=2933292 RepID=A0ABT2KBW2_9RHOB|nr:HTTM domain-containing protein [Paracoccus sp. YLB-12]
MWSLDAWSAPRRDRRVPYLSVFMLRAQTEIVLIYAGLVKLTPDWLLGQPLRLWLQARTEGTWLAPMFQMDWIILAASWGVIALHVLGAPLLLWRRARLARRPAAPRDRRAAGRCRLRPPGSDDFPAAHRADRRGAVAGGADRAAGPRGGLQFRTPVERRRPPFFLADADI